MSTPLEVPPYLSPSSIETFQTCPLKYKFSRVDRLTEPPSEAAVLGNYVHDTLEELLKLPPADRTEASAKQLLASLWAASPDPEQESWGVKAMDILKDEEAGRKFRWRAWWCVENYFQMEDPPNVVYGGLETPLAVEVDGVPIKGFIDRWDPVAGGFNIVDYKTGKTPAPRFRDKKFQQLLIYATALGDVLELEAKEMTLLFVKDQETLTQTVTPVSIKKTRDMIVSTYEEIKDRCGAGEFEPKVNNLCKNWCSFRHMCPAWR